MTERKKLELVECFIHPDGDVISNPVCVLNHVWKPGVAINTTKRDLLDAFHEVYLQGQRDKENNVLHAPNLFNILGLKE